MNDAQWRALQEFKTDFKSQVSAWQAQIEEAGLLDQLQSLQKRAADRDGVPLYSLDTPLVYNSALDDIQKTDDIRIILIGDNPGKDEQLARNRRYLVGQSGKIADGFFRKNPELNIDFRKNVLILNKTPLHTAKTKELALIIKEGNPLFAEIIEESQIRLARATVRLHRALYEADDTGNPCKLWLIGYAELRERGLFSVYRDALNAAYAECSARAAPAPISVSAPSERKSGCASQVFVYQHFSMNRFLIDLKERSHSSLSLAENIEHVGRAHRKDILGW
ncbi:hypothetical protein V1L52_12770 [Treponema sp. HNW]|uniref:hypothetical protein n=1 Tax=Treponema sp. HNW TaxID=3116654 RepID=UPI003D0CEF7C